MECKIYFLILFTTFVSYLAARFLEKTDNVKRKRWILIGSSILCLGVLFFFKYFNFISDSIVSVLKIFTIRLNPITLNLMLPVGISFYTFQTLSYVIDVYRGDVQAEHHFGKYATFISFFPQLVAGPIERTQNLMPQIKAKHIFDYKKATYGLKLMAWGFFKKMVVADNLAQYVARIYDDPQQFQGFSLVLATMFFSIQIYCDFSGYSDIAIGTAKLFGIDLMTNFKSPYFAQSIKEFWSRWHISLSTWFKDYIYIPLGGNRVSKIRHYINLVITFLISGLWHGANWTFVVWGGVHGIAQVIENVFRFKGKKSKKRISWIIKVCFTFAFCSFAWIFFVSNSLSDAIYVITHLLSNITNPIVYCKEGFINLGISKGNLLIVSACILLLALFDFISLKKDVISEISSLKKSSRWPIYICLVLIIIFLSQKGVTTEFVYFQF